MMKFERIANIKVIVYEDSIQEDDNPFILYSNNF